MQVLCSVWQTTMLKVPMFRLIHSICLSAYSYYLDCVEFLRFSGTLSPYGSRERWIARLTKKYHSIEKGLSLSKPRPGFGKQTVLLLVSDVGAYVERYGMDETARVTLNVLDNYRQFSQDNSVMDVELLESLKRVSRIGGGAQSGSKSGGGTFEIAKADIMESASIDFRSFAFSRHSVRQFVDEPISNDTVIEAVRIAQRSPSVCNRQPWRLHVYRDLQQIQGILACQNGNRGFGDQAAAILLVTSDLSAFEGAQERNEAYVDGGMFSMSLVYALHSLGLGSCCLNLCQQNYQSRRTKTVCGVPKNEVLIMMIAVGVQPDQMKVAFSHRREVEEIVEVHEPMTK